MGIGNEFLERAYGLRLPLITPHGDWEPRIRAFQDPYLILLITPHGDWEHELPLFSKPDESSHYPSWGLGTGLSRHGSASLIHLITPHGDWEPATNRDSP